MQLEPEANTFSEQHSSKNIQENRGCQSCEPNDNSVGSEPLGLLPPDENSFVKKKSYSGRSK